jgi:hypothetical protein
VAVDRRQDKGLVQLLKMKGLDKWITSKTGGSMQIEYMTESKCHRLFQHTLTRATITRRLSLRCNTQTDKTKHMKHRSGIRRSKYHIDYI